MTALLIHHNILYETVVSMFKIVISFFFFSVNLIDFCFRFTVQPKHSLCALLYCRRTYIYLRKDGEKDELDEVFMRHTSLKNAVFYIVLNTV